MKITFLGAAHEVTGSCTLVEACGYKFIIDCGMEQGADIYENSDLPISPAALDFVFLTHAHIDHSGKLPLLSKNGFKGKVFTTRATKDLCNIMLSDSAHIQETEAIWKNRRAKRSGNEEYTPMYTIEDVNAIMKCFEPFDYNNVVQIADGITVEFFDAGHLLGSSSIKLVIKEGSVTKKIVFSGDVGSRERPLLSDPKAPDEADIVVIESTYGDRTREPSKGGYEERLASIIESTLSKGGNVVIPSFAVGRTQELLYMIRRIKERNLTRINFPVWLDSPLAIEATNIYNGTLSGYYDEETISLLEKGINPISFDKLFVAVSSDESKQINLDSTPKVIISASGMCEAGRIRHHLKYNLWRPESTILFVGYQVEGTVGRRLLDGAKYISLFGEEIRVAARIEKLEGFSGHADREALVEWISSIKNKPELVYVNHGADTVCDDFSQLVSSSLGINSVAPYSGDSFDLITGEKLTEGNRERIKKLSRGKNKVKTTSIAWSKLYSAGMRLMNIIEGSKGRKNKDIAELTNKINAICEKQESLLRKRR